MKLKFLSLALISVAAGCTTNVEDTPYYLDVVHRVTDPVNYSGGPFVDMPNGRILGRVAFELNKAPAQAGSVSLNNDNLAWLPTGSAIGLDWSYGKADPNLYASQDSMAFSYVDFNGETYKDSVPVVPAFGAITFPDTVSVSHGCVISYQHPIPNDSIGIYLTVYGYDTSIFVTRPDTGSVVFAPIQLPVDPFGNEGFTIYFYRWNWSTRTTPSGKKIGVYSSMETDGQFIPVKP